MTNRNFIFLIIVMFLILPIVSAADSYLIEVSDVSPNVLMPGEETEISFEIENTGNRDISNIVFSWEEDTGTILPIGSSNTKSVEDLDAGDDETLEFNVFTSASAEPSLYKLTFTIKFETENGTVTQISKSGIIVGGETDFDVAVSDKSDGELLLSVANIGKNDANSVTVSIPTQTGFSISGATSSILGNIEKDDYSLVSFQVTSNSPSGILAVEISYTDTIGIRQTVSKQVVLSSGSSSKTTSTTISSNSQTTNAASFQKSSSENSDSSSNSLLYGVAGVSLLMLIVIGFAIKKIGNKKNEDN